MHTGKHIVMSSCIFDLLGNRLFEKWSESSGVVDFSGRLAVKHVFMQII